MQNSIAMKTFGINVRKLRDALGLSQDGLAQRVGVHRPYISQIERGLQNCTIDIIERIADVGHVPISKLFEDNFDPAECMDVVAA